MFKLFISDNDDDDDDDVAVWWFSFACKAVIQSAGLHQQQCNHFCPHSQGWVIFFSSLLVAFVVIYKDAIQREPFIQCLHIYNIMYLRKYYIPTYAVRFSL